MQDLYAQFQKRPRDQMVTMAATRIFFAAEQHGPLLQGEFHEPMDTLLVPGALAHRRLIELAPHVVRVIARGIVRTASQRVSRPLVREPMFREPRLEGFPVKVRDVAAIRCTSDIEHHCGVMQVEQVEKFFRRHAAVADREDGQGFWGLDGRDEGWGQRKLPWVACIPRPRAVAGLSRCA